MSDDSFLVVGCVAIGIVAVFGEMADYAFLIAIGVVIGVAALRGEMPSATTGALCFGALCILGGIGLKIATRRKTS